MMAVNDTELLALRHALHRLPELSMRERETKNRLMAFLGEHTELALHDMGHWFYAFRKGNVPGRIAFRADMDALPVPDEIDAANRSQNPGIGHKCGHDGHAAVLCGAAAALSGADSGDTVTEVSEDNAGGLRRLPDIYFVFQHAEETGEGGQECAAFLKAAGVQEVYAFHNRPGFPKGMIVCRRGITQPASEGLTVRFRGEMSHASEPEKGRNPARAVSELALWTGTRASSRQADAGGLLLCTIVGIRVGTGDFGISPGEGELAVTLRASREADMLTLESEILAEAGRLAARDGLLLEHSVRDYFPATENADACVRRVFLSAEQNGFPAREAEEIWRASEDFGYYTAEIPGAMFYIGCGTDYPALHTTGYDFCDGILPAAVRMFTRIAALYGKEGPCVRKTEEVQKG